MSDFSVQEVVDAIKKIKTGKAPGHDQISIATIKVVSAENCRFLTEALNLWGHSRDIPQEHLRAMIISLYKNGNMQIFTTTDLFPCWHMPIKYLFLSSNPDSLKFWILFSLRYNMHSDVRVPLYNPYILPGESKIPQNRVEKIIIAFLKLAKGIW